jgi:hypothetical protein
VSVAAQGTDSAVAVLRRRQSSQPRAGPTRASSTPSHEALTLRGRQRFSVVGPGQKLFFRHREEKWMLTERMTGAGVPLFSTAN